MHIRNLIAIKLRKRQLIDIKKKNTCPCIC